MSNLLDLALHFEKTAKPLHFKEFFGDDWRTALTVCNECGVMTLYQWIGSQEGQQRFATYLTNRFTPPECPSVEWIPMGPEEWQIHPDVNTDTEVVSPE